MKLCRFSHLSTSLTWILVHIILPHPHGSSQPFSSNASDVDLTCLISSRQTAMYLASSSLWFRMPRTRSLRFLSISRARPPFTFIRAILRRWPQNTGSLKVTKSAVEIISDKQRTENSTCPHFFDRYQISTSRI